MNFEHSSSFKELNNSSFFPEFQVNFIKKQSVRISKISFERLFFGFPNFDKLGSIMCKA